MLTRVYRSLFQSFFIGRNIYNCLVLFFSPISNFFPKTNSKIQTQIRLVMEFDILDKLFFYLFSKPKKNQLGKKNISGIAIIAGFFRKRSFTNLTQTVFFRFFWEAMVTFFTNTYFSKEKLRKIPHN